MGSSGGTVIFDPPWLTTGAAFVTAAVGAPKRALVPRLDVCVLTSAGYRPAMTFGASIFLLAAGAILKFAVTDRVSDVNLETVGVILMIAGALGILLSLLVAPPWAARDREVVEDRPFYRRW